MTNFWQNLPKPFFALAPMDAVTDTVFRHVVAKAARPDIFFTEFTNSAAFFSDHGRKSTDSRLLFTADEQPLVAQIWGTDPEHYAFMARELAKRGFAGIDINMGCPVKDVVKKGSCAGLIETPELAAKLIAAAKEGGLPVSVKTRIGFKTIRTEEWLSFLLKQDIVALTVHGRTAKEMSKVPAHWDEIAKAVKLRDQIAPQTKIIGNGDVRDRAHGLELIKQTGVDGIMIGRGVFHNPYCFEAVPRERTPEELLNLLHQHLDLFEQTWGNVSRPFAPLKRFFKIYVRDFDGAHDLRAALMETTNIADARIVLQAHSSSAKLKETQGVYRMDTSPTPTQPAAAPEPVAAPAPAHPPQPHHAAPEHHEAAHHDYPSNPITTAKMGLAKFWRNAKGSLVGNLGVQTLVFVGMVITIILVMLGFAAVLLGVLSQGSADISTQALFNAIPPELTKMFNSGSSMAVWSIVGLIGLVGTIILAVYLQAIQFATVAKTTIHNQPVTVGEALKLAGSKIWPLIGQCLLIGLVVMVVIIAFMIIAGGAFSALYSGSAEAIASAGVNAIGIFLLALVVFVAFVYFAIRFCFAPLAVVAENVGPVAAFKHSWHMTKGHFWEVLGVLAVVSTITTLASFVMDLITTPLADANAGLSLIVSIALFVGYLLVIMATTAMIAERYLQLRNVPAAHKSQAGLNAAIFVGAIVIAIVTSSIQSALFQKTYEIPTNNLPGDSTYPIDDSTLPSYDESDYPPADATDEEIEQYLRDKYPELYDTELPTQQQ